MQAFSGYQGHDLQTSLTNESCIASAKGHASVQILFTCPRPANNFCYKTSTVCSLLTRCTFPCACHGKRHLNVRKCSAHLGFFALVAWTSGSRHSQVHSFDISISKKVPRMRCVVHVDFHMCFALQRSPHLNISTSKSGPRP